MIDKKWFTGKVLCHKDLQVGFDWWTAADGEKTGRAVGHPPTVSCYRLPMDWQQSPSVGVNQSAEVTCEGTQLGELS